MAKVKDVVVGDVERNVRGVLPIYATESIDADFLAESLKKLDVQELPFRRIPVPVDIQTYARLSYICKTYSTSFAQLMSDLVSVALPQVEAKLNIKEQDVVEHFNKNKPDDCVDLTAITVMQLNNAVNGVFDGIKKD